MTVLSLLLFWFLSSYIAPMAALRRGGTHLSHIILSPTSTASSVTQSPIVPVVILHGLLGSSKNFQSWAKLLQAKLSHPTHMILLDLRNHGLSPHHQDMSYEAMADDVLATVSKLGVSTCHLVGHSMGGKVAAMCTDRRHHHEGQLRIRSLSMLDICPTAYSREEFSFLDKSFRSLEAIAQHWHQYSTKAQIYDALVVKEFPDPAFSRFILSNIVRNEEAGGSPWKWVFNFDAIRLNHDNILDFPSELHNPTTPLGLSDTFPTFIMKGARSSFVKSSHLTKIKALFPSYSMATIAAAGHWLHVEQPEDTTNRMAQFIEYANSVEFQSQVRQQDAVVSP